MTCDLTDNNCSVVRRYVAALFIFSVQLVALLDNIEQSARAGDDETASGEEQQQLRSPREGLPVSRKDRMVIQARVDELNGRILALLRFHKLPEAISARKQLVEYLSVELGDWDLETLRERIYLKELEKVSTLSSTGRAEYFSARDSVYLTQPSFEKCDFERARPLLEEALTKYCSSIGDASAAAIGTREKLGFICLANNKVPEAMSLFSKNLESCRSLTGTLHPCYASCLRNVGLCCYERRDFEKAESFLRDALAIYRRVGGSNCDEYIGAQEDFCKVAIAMHRFPEAEAMCRSAMAILEVKDPKSVFAAGYLFNWANIHVEYEDDHKAEELMRRAITIYEGALPQRSITLKRARERFIWLLNKLELFEEANIIAERISRAEK